MELFPKSDMMTKPNNYSKKTICNLVYFTVAVDLRAKIKENKKIQVWPDFTRIGENVIKHKNVGNAICSWMPYNDP